MLTKTTSNALADDLLFGAQAIADELGIDTRKTFYLLERHLIPGRKVGGTWTAMRSQLRRHFEDVDAASAATPAPALAPAPKPTSKHSKRSKRRATR
jgi:hypothetical protein